MKSSCLFFFLSIILAPCVYVLGIIGGSNVDIIKHSYLVSIRYKASANDNFWHKCGGVIYTDKVVLTSVQCMNEIGEGEQVMVVAGANTRTGADGMPYAVEKWIAHPDFSTVTGDYDVGVMIIRDRFDLDHFSISSIKIKDNRPVAGTFGTIAGWGYREEFGPSSTSLEDAVVPIVSQQDCINIYGASEVTERMICAGYVLAGGTDACQGDTGGPLLVNKELVGLVSWGRGCARPGYPSAYTFVSSLKSWIEETIAANV